MNAASRHISRAELPGPPPSWWRRLLVMLRISAGARKVRRLAKRHGGASGLFVVDSTVRVAGIVRDSHFENCTIITENDTMFIECSFVGDIVHLTDPALGREASLGFQLCSLDPTDMGEPGQEG